MQSYKKEALKPCSLTPPKHFNPVKSWLISQLINYGKQLGFAKQAVKFERKRPKNKLSREKAKQIFSQYQPTHHDVFVTTFPKSGTNWLLQIAQQIAHRGDAEFEHIHHVVAYPDSLGSCPSLLSDPKRYQLSPTGLRVIKTHLKPDFIPYHDQAKYLTVLRDPKEVFVSNYYFTCGLMGLLEYVSIDDWYQISLKNMVRDWASHTTSIWNWQDRPNTLILNYREMKKNPQLAIDQVAATMGLELTKSQLAKILKRSSLEYMKAHESQFSPPPLPFIHQPKPTLMIRHGKAGEARKDLSKTQLVEIDRACQAELQLLGSDFPYRSTFGIEHSKNSAKVQ